MDAETMDGVDLSSNLAQRRKEICYQGIEGSGEGVNREGKDRKQKSVRQRKQRFLNAGEPRSVALARSQGSPAVSSYRHRGALANFA